MRTNNKIVIFLKKYLSLVLLVLILLWMVFNYILSLTTFESIYDDYINEEEVNYIELVDSRSYPETVTLDEEQTSDLLSSNLFNNALNISLRNEGQGYSIGYYTLNFYMEGHSIPFEIRFTDNDLSYNGNYYSIDSDYQDALVEVFVNYYY